MPKFGGTILPKCSFGGNHSSQMLFRYCEPIIKQTVQQEMNMRHWMRPLATAVLTTAWLLSVPAANGQAQSLSPGLSDQSPNIPDQKLEAAAAALQNVASLRDGYQRQMEAADPSERARIADEANNALAKAVTDQGLSVEEFTSILRVARNDPAIREKILQRAK